MYAHRRQKVVQKLLMRKVFVGVTLLMMELVITVDDLVISPPAACITCLNMSRTGSHCFADHVLNHLLKIMQTFHRKNIPNRLVMFIVHLSIPIPIPTSALFLFRICQIRWEILSMLIRWEC